MNSKRWTLLPLLLLLPALAAATPVVLNEVFASGGGESSASGVRMKDTLGQPCVGGGALVGTGVRLRDGFWTPRSESTPVFLLAFNFESAPGRVELIWSCVDADAEFRLAATLGDSSWELPWTRGSDGLYTAVDEVDLLIDGGACVYRLEGRLAGEGWQLLRVIDVEVPPLPLVTALNAPHPNPFNPTVTLPIQLAADARVQVQLYDVSGRLRARILDQAMTRGRHAVTWSARDDAGQELPSGVYFIHLRTTGYSATRKLVLLR
jgi:hypothetical protein